MPDRPQPSRVTGAWVISNTSITHSSSLRSQRFRPIWPGPSFVAVSPVVRPESGLRQHVAQGRGALGSVLLARKHQHRLALALVEPRAATGVRARWGAVRWNSWRNEVRGKSPPGELDPWCQQTDV